MVLKSKVNIQFTHTLSSVCLEVIFDKVHESSSVIHLYMSQYSGFVFKNDFKIASCRHGKTIQPFYQELVVDEVEIKTYQP